MNGLEKQQDFNKIKLNLDSKVLSFKTKQIFYNKYWRDWCI